MRKIWAFFTRDLQNEMSYRLSFWLQILSILPIVAAFFYLSRVFGHAVSGPLQPYGGDYFPFVLIGVAVQGHLTQSLNGFSSSIRESQLSGTLEMIMATPTSLFTLLAGSTLYGFFFNALRVFIYLAAGALLFQARFHWTRLPVVILTLALTATAFSAVGMFSAAFVIAFKKGDPVNWVFGVMSFLLGGVYYPVAVLPEWVQAAAQWIPTTHALEAMRQALLFSDDRFHPWSHLLILAAWSAVCLPPAVACCSMAVKHALRKGSLGHY